MTRLGRLLMLGLGALVLIAASGSMASASSAWCARTSFHFKDAQFQYVQDKFAEAQVLLTVMPQGEGGAAGTGFLIQASPPVLLTARHVVELAQKAPSVPIVGYVATVPPREVRLQILASHPSEDLALLTTIDGAPYPVPDVRAFEVNVQESFAKPGLDVAFPGMAFISSDVLRQAASSIDSQKDEVMVSPDLATGKYPSRRTFRTDVYDGDSGAPVFLADGTVVAVVANRRSNILAEIVPVHEIVDWLVEELSATQPDDLMHRLLEGGEEHLFQALNPQRCRSCLTNLQLLIAGRKLNEAGDHFSVSAPPAEILICPLRDAMNQRGLFKGREWIDAYLEGFPSDADEEDSEVDRAELMQQSLQTAAYLVQHRPANALALIDDIEPRLVRRLDEDISHSPEQFYSTLCLASEPDEIRDGAIEALQEAGLTDTAEKGRQMANEVSCGQVFGTDDWAAQLQNLAELQVLRGNLQAGDQARPLYEQALGTASLAALFAKTPEQLATTHLTIARTAELVGDQDTSLRVIARARLEADTDMAANDGLPSRSVEHSAEHYTGEVLAGITADELIGMNVVDATGDSVGSVADLLLGADNEVNHAIIDVGGFLGFGAKSVAIPLSELSLAEGDGDDVVLDTTFEQLVAMPEWSHADDGWTSN